MGKATKTGFNPKVFLGKVGTGKTISNYCKDQIIFAQGDSADAIFYLQKGKVKIVVMSDQGKEAVVAILEPDQFFGEGCLVSSFMNKFRKLGFISYNGKIEVHRSLLNAVLYEKPEIDRAEKEN
jgi:glutamine cyclotransferase